MGRNRKPFPDLKTHRGRARVWWRGHWHYLGEAESEEANQGYAQFVARIAANPDAPVLPASDLIIGELMDGYLKSLTTTASLKAFAQASRVRDLLNELYRDTPVAEFGPVAADTWRLWLASDSDGAPNLSSTTIRAYLNVVKDSLSWAVRTEQIEAEQTKLAAIRELRPLPRGKARPKRKILPVPDEIVERTLPHLRGPVAAMVRLQRLTGMRPTEVMRLTPSQVHRAGRVTLSSGMTVDLDRFPGVWVYVPTIHKMQSRGKPRDIVLGPKAQAVLSRFLERAAEAHCFSPAESMAELRAEQLAARAARGGGSGGNRKRKSRVKKRKIGDRYTGDSYGKAIKQACELHGIPHWHPYQLRHTAGTEAVAEHGLDAARAMLGHDDPRTTMIYGERDFGLAAKIAVDGG
jgi:integrase